MYITVSLEEQDADEIIKACKTLKGSPVLWLLSDRLQQELDELRSRQTEVARAEAYSAARAAWQHHMSTARCQACNHALASYYGPTKVLEKLCNSGKTLYENLLDATACL